jgi:hypothetical protein
MRPQFTKKISQFISKLGDVPPRRPGYSLEIFFRAKKSPKKISAAILHANPSIKVDKFVYKQSQNQ